jgi:hypothetical protein
MQVGSLFDKLVAFMMWQSSGGLWFSDDLDPITGNSLGKTKESRQLASHE